MHPIFEIKCNQKSVDHSSWMNVKLKIDSPFVAISNLFYNIGENWLSISISNSFYIPLLFLMIEARSFSISTHISSHNDCKDYRYVSGMDGPGLGLSQSVDNYKSQKNRRALACSMIAGVIQDFKLNFIFLPVIATLNQRKIKRWELPTTAAGLTWSIPDIYSHSWSWPRSLLIIYVYICYSISSWSSYPGLATSHERATALARLGSDIKVKKFHQLISIQ